MEFLGEVQPAGAFASRWPGDGTRCSWAITMPSVTFGGSVVLQPGDHDPARRIQLP